MTAQDSVIQSRRATILDYLSRGYSQAETARELHISEPTVSRDVDALRQSANESISDCIEKLPLEHAKSMAAINQVLKEAFELAQEKDLEPADKIASLKLVTNTIQVRMALLTDATILDKAVKQNEALKKQLEALKKEQNRPKYELVSWTEPASGKKGESKRTFRKVDKKKQVEVIV